MYHKSWRNIQYSKYLTRQHFNIKCILIFYFKFGLISYRINFTTDTQVNIIFIWLFNKYWHFMVNLIYKLKHWHKFDFIFATVTFVTPSPVCLRFNFFRFKAELIISFKIGTTTSVHTFVSLYYETELVLFVDWIVFIFAKNEVIMQFAILKWERHKRKTNSRSRVHIYIPDFSGKYHIFSAFRFIC